MNAEERAAQVVAEFGHDYPERLTAAITRHLEGHRREGMLEMRQACADALLDRCWPGEQHALLDAARAAVLTTPLPGEGERA